MVKVESLNCGDGVRRVMIQEKERSSRSDLFVTFGQGALKTWVPGLPKNWRIINFLVALGENKTQSVGNDEQREARKNLGGLQPRSRRG